MSNQSRASPVTFRLSFRLQAVASSDIAPRLSNSPSDRNNKPAKRGDGSPGSYAGDSQQYRLPENNTIPSRNDQPAIVNDRRGRSRDSNPTASKASECVS